MPCFLSMTLFGLQHPRLRICPANNEVQRLVHLLRSQDLHVFLFAEVVGGVGMPVVQARPTNQFPENADGDPTGLFPIHPTIME